MSYVKVNGVWRYVYRAVDQHGQTIDVLLSARRDAAPIYPGMLDELLPGAWHHVEQYETDEIVKVGWPGGAHRRGVPAGLERAGGVGCQAAVTVW